jgi:hypothetical protein
LLSKDEKTILKYKFDATLFAFQSGFIYGV